MSALQFLKIGNSFSGDRCLEEGCGRSGRYAVVINDLPIPSASKLAFYPNARICLSHKRAWEKLWADLSGANELKEVEAAVRDLKAPAPTRTEAIFRLREAGFSKDDIARALQGVGEGLEVEEILERVCGCGDERVAVAA